MLTAIRLGRIAVDALRNALAVMASLVTRSERELSRARNPTPFPHPIADVNRYERAYPPHRKEAGTAPTQEGREQSPGMTHRHAATGSSGNGRGALVGPRADDGG